MISHAMRATSGPRTELRAYLQARVSKVREHSVILASESGPCLLLGPSSMKLEWTESESDYGLEEAAFYEGPPVVAPPPTKHVSFSLRLDLCDEGGGNADGIKTEPVEAEEPRAMQKVPSLSDLSDPEASLGERVDMGTEPGPRWARHSIHRLLDLRTSATTERIPFTTSE
ncbi:unnamed protein product [Chrysodeixis includens]|uniref:Uncharacterized protein n=1 Tax=Chrysodeixis includens TaxID=689277 RepID=A0A9N8L4J4_CHRIL|nr:unnamed protein product [Chrysodeixis includens]